MSKKDQKSLKSSPNFVTMFNPFPPPPPTFLGNFQFFSKSKSTPTSNISMHNGPGCSKKIQITFLPIGIFPNLIKGLGKI